MAVPSIARSVACGPDGKRDPRIDTASCDRVVWPAARPRGTRCRARAAEIPSRARWPPPRVCLSASGHTSRLDSPATVSKPGTAGVSVAKGIQLHPPFMKPVSEIVGIRRCDAGRPAARGGGGSPFVGVGTKDLACPTLDERPGLAAARAVFHTFLRRRRQHAQWSGDGGRAAWHPFVPVPSDRTLFGRRSDTRRPVARRAPARRRCLRGQTSVSRTVTVSCPQSFGSSECIAVRRRRATEQSPRRGCLRKDHGSEHSGFACRVQVDVDGAARDAAPLVSVANVPNSAVSELPPTPRPSMVAGAWCAAEAEASPLASSSYSVPVALALDHLITGPARRFTVKIGARGLGEGSSGAPARHCGAGAASVCGPAAPDRDGPRRRESPDRTPCLPSRAPTCAFSAPRHSRE